MATDFCFFCFRIYARVCVSAFVVRMYISKTFSIFNSRNGFIFTLLFCGCVKHLFLVFFFCAITGTFWFSFLSQCNWGFSKDTCFARISLHIQYDELTLARPTVFLLLLLCIYFTVKSGVNIWLNKTKRRTHTQTERKTKMSRNKNDK